ncbi:hypothetical protein GH714_000918 [Hevea brasiliensis]|uniref:Uncharacterized protein n=1 Tax=Hevea brasiliensis TaxID=3981 RepID=A0A6A6NAY3_HEVBR|nr:hypothetical protein GH714_000918 [Hevea brasiliensis]
MESDSDPHVALQNPIDGGRRPTMEKEEEEKPKVVVIMGPTGSGKSKLAIDLASHFPIEIINADSMQVYYGLDVLTNKVPLHDQKGVPHHLLGTVSPNAEFTAKNFRDSAIPLITEIQSRNHLPVIVGALVSPFLLDDTADDLDENFQNQSPGDEQTDQVPEFGRSSFNSYDYLKDLDPVAANRIHPNNHRKINQYLNLYARFGILPSRIYEGKAAEVGQNWGRIDNCRFDCCFICVDAAIPVLDQYVGQRVDCMIDAGLLGEVYDIYNPNSDYTRGLRQAIGVREFEDFLRAYLLAGRNDKASDSTNESLFMMSANKDKILKNDIREVLYSSDNNELKVLLAEAIDKMKANTRRLVRRQKRMLTRLQTLFGWNIHYVDATESISCKSDESWSIQVVGPAVQIIRSFLSEDGDQCLIWGLVMACGDRVLRGAHEWEQHKQGRGHRKRISQLRKLQGQGFSLVEQDFQTINNDQVSGS